MKQNIKLAQGEKKERETVVESNTEVPQESTLPSSWRPPPKPTTEVQLSVLQHLHLHHLTLTPGALPACLHRDLSTTLPRSSSTWGLRTRKTPKKQDQPCLIYFFLIIICEDIKRTIRWRNRSLVGGIVSQRQCRRAALHPACRW